jgi:hypothetical protein
MRPLLVLACVIGLAAPAAAQNTSQFDVSGGYSLLRDNEAEENFHGWLASATGYVTPWLGIVGELGRNSKTIRPPAELGTDLELKANVLAYAGGVKFAGGAGSNVRPFAQVLAGGARFDATLAEMSETETHFMLQPGVGVDMFFGRHFGVRVGGDYRRVFIDEEDIDGVNEFRFHIGVVIR